MKPVSVLGIAVVVLVLLGMIAVIQVDPLPNASAKVMSGGPDPEVRISAASAGTLDTDFGSGGIATAFGPTSEIYGLVVDSVGRLIAVGNWNDGSNYLWAVARFGTDGTLDGTFGSSGVVTLFGGPADKAYDVAVDSSNNVVVVGRVGFPNNDQFTVVRLLAGNGGLDLSFDGDGIAQTTINKNGAVARAVAIQADAKIVVAGYSSNKKAYEAITLARYNPDGSLDTDEESGFGPIPRKNRPRLGFVIDDLDGAKSEGVFYGAIALQGDGKIIVGGYDNISAQHSTTTSGWAILRYNTDGSRDTGFGSDGIVSATAYDEYTRLHLKGLTVQPDGKIVASGRGLLEIPFDFDTLVVRYDANGTLDPDFSDDGIVGAGLLADQGENHGGQVAVHEGKIAVCSGSSYTMNGFVLRFNPDGSRDTTFDDDGLSELVPGLRGFAPAIAVDDNGDVYHGAVRENSFAVARFCGTSSE